jgi:hypothetical protein
MGRPSAHLPKSQRACFLLLGLSLAACRTGAPLVPRYVVTVTPFSVVDPRHPGLCVAVDPADAHGVWWWEPGPSGCSTRTTGPTVFRAHLATVGKPSASGAIDVGFQVPLMVGPPRDVRLVLHDNGMREVASGTQVSTERRSNLDIPPAYDR